MDAAKAAAHGGLVDALRNAHGQRGAQLLAVGRQADEPEHGERVAQRLVGAAVALPARREPLLAHEAQRLVEGEDEAHGRDVVVRAPPPAIGPLREQADEVEVRGAAGPDAPLELAQRAVARGQRRKAGRRAEAGVAHRERDVHLRLVDPQRLAAQRRRAVQEQQRVVLATGGAEPVERLRHPGRALAVHDGERAAAAVHRRDEPSGFQRPPELALDADHLGAGAGQRAREPLAEQARDAADDAVAGVHEVDDRRLHAGAAGAGQRQRGAAARGERLAQKDLGLVHDRREGRVHGSRGDLAQACAHALRQGAGTGAEQQRLGRGHGASMSGKCSARWERSASRTKRRSSCEATR